MAKKTTKKKAATNKTGPTKRSVPAFIKKSPAKFHEDSETLIEIMSAIVGEPAVMWGESIVGFGSYHYVYESGREGDCALTGFSPRASEISVYLMCGLDGHEELLEKLGRHRMGKSCLYLKGLDGVHLPTLKKLIRLSIKKTIKQNQ